MRMCLLTCVAAVSVTLAAQVPTAAVAPKPDPAEQAAAKSLMALYNDPATAPNSLDAAIDDFESQYPNSPSRFGALVLGVRYHRDHEEYLPELRYGMAALRLHAHDLYVLSSLGIAIPANVKPSDLDRDQMLDQAAEFNRQVIAQTDAWMVTEQGLDYGGRHYSQAQATQMRDNLDGPAYIALGQVATLQDKPADAVTAYQQALPYEITPAQQAEAYYDIGAAEVLQNHAPEARAALAKAKQLAGGSALLLQLIAVEENKLTGK